MHTFVKYLTNEKDMQQLTPLTMNMDDTVDVRMTVREFMELFDRAQGRQERNVGKGLNGIMAIFDCSRAKACQISHADWFQPAIILREGRFLSFDIDMVRELARKVAG